MLHSNLFMNMLFNVAFISFLATILCRLKWFREVFWNARLGIRQKILLTLCFSTISIFATYIGTNINGAILNCRMIGVVSAGLLGGPAVGISTAVIASVHRYFYDVNGFTSAACAVSTLLEGAVGVFFHERYIEGRLKHHQLAIIATMTEIIQMVCILIISKPYEAAVNTVMLIGLPMIIMNSCGEVVFIETFRQILDEGSNEAALRAAQKEKLRTQEEKEKKMLARAEFLNLQNQVNPHFLYNCLNTISFYIRSKPEEAVKMLKKLASYYRYSANEMEDFVPLDSELDHVSIYLELEKARFEEKLNTSIDISSDIDDNNKVPSLILQPLVENAIIHGRDEYGRCDVDINVNKSGKMLRIEVSDKGEGMPDDIIEALMNGNMPSNKIGLQNVHKRLKLLTGNGLLIENTNPGCKIIMEFGPVVTIAD